MKEARPALANFFASGVLRLKEKLGPILWQLLPNFRFEPDILMNFFEILPRDTGEAALLARQHNSQIKSRAWLQTDQNRPLRHALEIRHDSFRAEAFIKLLRKHEIGLVVADTVEWPLLMDATADFVYVRLHGSREFYASGYGSKTLDTWAQRIRAWTAGREAKGVHAGPPAPRRGRDVYVYFDNDIKVRAPFDAMTLQKKLSPNGICTSNTGFSERLSQATG